MLDIFYFNVVCYVRVLSSTGEEIVLIGGMNALIAQSNVKVLVRSGTKRRVLCIPPIVSKIGEMQFSRS